MKVRIRYWVAVAGVVALVALLFFALRPAREIDRGPEGEAPDTVQAAEPGGSHRSQERAAGSNRERGRNSASDDRIYQAGVAHTARLLSSPNATGADDLAILESLLLFYRRYHSGQLPQGGLNHEIVADLLGRNPKRLSLLPPDLPCLSPSGELLDRWGTAYFFHPVSDDLMEVRSAGPDRKFWTADDIQVPPVLPDGDL